MQLHVWCFQNWLVACIIANRSQPIASQRITSRRPQPIVHKLEQIFVDHAPCQMLADVMVNCVMSCFTTWTGCVFFFFFSSFVFGCVMSCEKFRQSALNYRRKLDLSKILMEFVAYNFATCLAEILHLF